MKTNKVAILTVASLATLALANNAKADSQDSPVSSQEAPTALVTNSEGNNTTEAKQPTEITKEGTEITVKNPDVTLTYPEGHGIYAKMQVNYHVDFPDGLAIKENDTVEMKLPEVMEFPTSYSFDVTNPEGKVVGNAVADSSLGKVTTTFNNYFESHPLNKQMNLELTTRWTDAVKPDTKFEISLDGTVIPITVEKEVTE